MITIYLMRPCPAFEPKVWWRLINHNGTVLEADFNIEVPDSEPIGLAPAIDLNNRSTNIDAYSFTPINYPQTIMVAVNGEHWYAGQSQVRSYSGVMSDLKSVYNIDAERELTAILTQEAEEWCERIFRHT